MSIIRYRTPELATWTPFDRLSPLRDLLDSAYRLTGSVGASAWSPALDVYEDADTVTVKVELAGMKKEDFELSLEDGALTVSGKRELKEENRESFRSERFFGSFSRTIALPCPVNSDNVKAAYEDGILTVVLHKTDEAKPRKIPVS
ncbi:MAG: Hsp20/alpha crystallin family protein [Terrimicrobiaceae bacterium]|jgi:HSP20 family protein|nr:Hsp20/alpha crystallin family protein [Terrimicrobiaceae bacterium]